MKNKFVSLLMIFGLLTIAYTVMAVIPDTTIPPTQNLQQMEFDSLRVTGTPGRLRVKEFYFVTMPTIDSLRFRSLWLGRTFPDTIFVKTLTKTDTLYGRSVKMGRSFPDSVFVTKIITADTSYARSSGIGRIFPDSVFATAQVSIGKANLQNVTGADPYLRVAAPTDAGGSSAIMDLHDTVVAFVTDNTVDIGGATDNRPKNIYASALVKSDTSYARSVNFHRAFIDSLTATAGGVSPDTLNVKSVWFGRSFPDTSYVKTLAKSDTSYSRSLTSCRTYTDTVTVTTLVKSDTSYARSVKSGRSFPDSLFVTKLAKTDTSYARSSKFGRIDPDTVRVTTNVITDSVNARSVKFTRTSIDSAGIGLAGSSSLPALYWTSQRNTGIYLIGTSSVGISANGTCGLYVSANAAQLGNYVTPYHRISNYTPTTGNSLLPSFGVVSTTHNGHRSTRDTAEDSSAIYGRIASTGAPVFGMRESTGKDVVTIDSLGNAIIGSSTILATNATNGFLYLPFMAGAPTGVPTLYTNRAAMVVDTTNDRIYLNYSMGAPLATWFYWTKTGGFEIPTNEVGDKKIGDYVVGVLTDTKSDGALHGVWTKLEDTSIIKQLKEENQLLRQEIELLKQKTNR